MTSIDNTSAQSPEDQALRDAFLAQNILFHGPDPDIMANHHINPRSDEEERILGKDGLDPHLVNQVRGRLVAALDESNTMLEQMGAAPGAKWGDIVAAIFTPTGDLSMIAPKGVVGFAGCCHYPIKFIIETWADEPTVGIKDGDGFIHNDARYGGIHNTDQSTIMPLYYKGNLVAWLSATIHEGENGSIEPGGMPAAAESKFDEGLKMPPFKVIENFEIKRDLQTFLQNSVRDPKLQYEDMAVKLHSILRLRKRVEAIMDEFGPDVLVGTMRQHIEGVAAEVRRRVAELPDGTTRVNGFCDSTLRENVLCRISCAITVEGDKMTMDFTGSSPEFLNRSINTNQASFKTMLMSGFLQNIWPDLPQTQAVFDALEFVFEENSLVNGSFMTPQAMSLIPLFKAMTFPVIPMAKFIYQLPNQYTSIVASQYDQPATMIYGGLTQNGQEVGNFCADINGNGQGGRYNQDGEHSVSPPFAAYCDIGEMELIEEELPIVRLGAFTLAKDRMGFGKFRGGMGYEQIATSQKTPMWGFMFGCTGSKFSSMQGLFGGYGSPSYPLCRVEGLDILKQFDSDPDNANFDMIDIMNRRPFPGGKYSTMPMAQTFKLVQEGELNMICQGTGAGYGDVLERDPSLVVKDIEEDLLSSSVAERVFKVIVDEKTLVLDTRATEQARTDERKARIARGKPFDEFVAEWVTDAPPEHLPYFGAWGADGKVYGLNMGERYTMEPGQLESMMMLNPKDVTIAALQAELELREARGK